MKSRKDLRRLLRAARKSIQPRSRRRAEAVIAARISRLAAYRRARKIAAYLPFDGEVDLTPLLTGAIDAGKTIYLPRLGSKRNGDMHFVRADPRDPLRPNRFGIGEPAPAAGRQSPPGSIDLVLVPLVGFDETGTRLGMGGGFYDRCFAALASRGTFRPRLVGVAFECQKLDHIQRMHWDVPLSLVVTERTVYRAAV